MRRWGSASASADSSRSSPSRRSTVDRAPPSLADGSRGGPLAAATEAQERGRQHPSPRGTRWREPDRSLRDGEDIVLERRTLRVCWTPGHTRGHIVFHDRANGLLFAGGHVLPDITPSLGLEPSPDGRALEQFLRPLRAARELVVDLVLPGHGAALRWTRRGRRFCELDTFNRMLAVGETVTHLELLVRDQRLRRDAARGRIVYALAP